MENKQQIILMLLRSMLRLMYKLTYVSRTFNTDELKHPIKNVRFNLDRFEKEFIKEEDEDEK